MPALTAIRVDGLFDRFTHVIKLNLDDRITILHGANGVGKTTVLRLIDSALRQRFSALRRIRFHGLELSFDDGTTVSISQEPNDGLDGPQRPQLFVSLDSGRPELLPIVEPRAGRDFPLNAIDDIVESLNRVGPREWIDYATNEVLDFEGVVERYGDQLPFVEGTAAPDWLTERLSSVPVYIIETQRLSVPYAPPRQRYSPSRPAPQTTAVHLLAQEISGLIRTALAEYAETSQRLDRTFPARLLDAGKLPTAEVPNSAIRERYEVQGQARSRLIAAGLLDAGEEIFLPTKKLNDTERKVLWTYFADVDQKLEVLRPMADKIDLFREVLNAKYHGKAVHVRRPEGFVVITDRGEELDPQYLSSGEQHELVLAYRLLFDVEPGSLILIDEPELSLHVSWQQMFLPDLERISRTAELDFVVATHSPIVIGDRWDLTVALATDQ